MDYRTWDAATSTFDDGGHWFDRPTSATMTRLSDGRLLLIGGIARGGSLSDAVWDLAFLRRFGIEQDLPRPTSMTAGHPVGRKLGVLHASPQFSLIA